MVKLVGLPNLEDRHQGGQLLGTGGILLRHFAHLRHSLVDLIDPLGLLPGSGGNLAHHFHHLRRAGTELLKRAIRYGHQIGPRFNSIDNVDH